MGRTMRISLTLFLILARSVFADELLHRFEGDVVPYDPGVGWELFDPCEGVCQESIEDGAFTLR